MPIIIASDGNKPGPDAEHHAAARLVVELDDAVRRRQRVVIRQRDDAGAELDPLRSLGRRCDEEFRRRDDLEPGRVVLADPRLFVAEFVEPFDEFDVAADRERRVFVQRMKRREKDPAAQR